MTTKELIATELGALNEKDLNELYPIIKNFVASRKHPSPSSLMSKLKRIKIDAPPDFATHGVKRANA